MKKDKNLKIDIKKYKDIDSQAITLISLVITILILIILAGIGLNLSIGENGIFTKAKYAKEKYLNEQKAEKEKINDLYSQMLIATGDDAKITISVKELRDIIQEEVNKNISVQPTGIKFDTYMVESLKKLETYSQITSMTGLTKTADNQNNISKYISYSSSNGYTVLKSGWYYFNLRALAQSANATETYTALHINSGIAHNARAWSQQNNRDTDYESFSIYLNEGDIFYFSSTATVSTAQDRSSWAIIYPMF